MSRRREILKLKEMRMATLIGTVKPTMKVTRREMWRWMENETPMGKSSYCETGWVMRRERSLGSLKRKDKYHLGWPLPPQCPRLQ